MKNWKSEEGFSLIELLATIVITTIISGAVAAAVVVAVKSTDATATRLIASGDAQTVARYFGVDVQAADNVTVGPAMPACVVGPGPDDVEVRSIVDLEGVLMPSNDDTSVVSYVMETEGTTDVKSLVRLACLRSSDGSVELEASRGRVVLIEELAMLPTLACGVPPAVCEPNPQQVKLSVTAIGCAIGVPCQADSPRQEYEYEVLGSRRAA